MAGRNEPSARIAAAVSLVARSSSHFPTSTKAMTTATACDACHVPTLRTRPDYPIAQLAGIAAPIYSDLLANRHGSLMNSSRDPEVVRPGNHVACAGGTPR